MKNEESRLLKLSFNVKTRESRKKEIEDRNLYNELIKKAQIEQKMKERELQAKEVLEKKKIELDFWKKEKDDKRMRFQERAHNFM